MHHNLVFYLIRLMNPQNEELTITSIQAIGNIAAEGHWERDCILKNNFLQKVIEFNQVTSSEKYRQWSL